MKRYDPIPIVQPGGYQPFAPAGGRQAGPALLAMLQGTTLYGQNPQDAARALQRSSKARPRRSLIESLLQK